MISRMAQVKVEHLTLPQRHKEPQETTKQLTQKHAYDDDEVSLTSKQDDEDASRTNDSSKSDDTIIEQSSDSQQIVCSTESHPLGKQAAKSERLGQDNGPKIHSADNSHDQSVAPIDNKKSPPESTTTSGNQSADPAEDKLATTVDSSQDVPTNQARQKESRCEEIIVDGFAIRAFSTWEELQDEVNEQIAQHKINESKNVVVPVAKNPRKSGKGKLKASTTSNDTKSNDCSSPAVVSAKRKLKSDKPPRKRTKKSPAPQPTSTTSDIDDAAKASKNSHDRRKDKATTSNNDKKPEAHQTNSSGDSSTHNSSISSLPLQSSDSQPQPSPQKRNQPKQAIHSQTHGKSHGQEIGAGSEISNTPREVKPTQENSPNIDPFHAGYGQFDHENQKNHSDSQGRVPSNQTSQPRDTLHQSSSSQHSPHQTQNQTPASSQNSQAYPNYPPYFYQQYAPSVPPYQHYGSYNYPNPYQTGFSRQQHIPNSTGYFPPGAYPAPNYQYPAYTPYHYPPPPYPGLPHPLPAGSSNSSLPSNSNQAYQAHAFQYNQNATSTGPASTQYPTAYPGYPPYVVTNTTISRQTSIIPPQLPHLPTSIPYQNSYGQPPGTTTSPQNRFSTYSAPQALIPSGHTLSQQYFNGQNFNAPTRAGLHPVSVQSAKSLPPSPIKNTVSITNGTVPRMPGGSGSNVNGTPMSPPKNWPCPTLDHQWAAAARYGLIGSIPGPRIAYNNSFLPGLPRVPNPMQPPSPR